MLNRVVCNTLVRFCHSKAVSMPLRSLKPKSTKNTYQHFIDLKAVRAKGGHGGNGCISFLSLWANEFAGPDGGDGGHGGHIIFQSSTDIKDLSHIPTVLQGDNGEKGYTQDCHGKSAEHTIVKVPIGTVVKQACSGTVVGDLHKEGMMFIAARGGAGGRGNHFFTSDTEQAPKICEYGAVGENLDYVIELSSMAHVGMIGFPNAGKSTLLRAISRARPKVAPYPFTTLKPHIGMVQYDDYTQIAVADLPGIIKDSHKNRGLGIRFLRHIERCKALLFVVDVSTVEPWKELEILYEELTEFNANLTKRPQLVIANKIDLVGDNREHMDKFAKTARGGVIEISAKLGTNVYELLCEIKKLTESDQGRDYSEINDVK